MRRPNEAAAGYAKMARARPCAVRARAEGKRVLTCRSEKRATCSGRSLMHQ